MAALEETILGYILVNRFQPEQLGLDKDFFKNQRQRQVFTEIKKGNYQIDLIVENIGGDGAAQDVARWMAGVPETKLEDVIKMISEIRTKRLNEEVRKLIHAGSQSGHYDDDKIRHIYQKVDALQKSENSIINLDEIEPEPISWFWHNKIPAKKLSFIGGDPGCGKSTLIHYMAAIISTGRDWPDAKNPFLGKPASVLLFSSEDGIGDTIRIRIEAMGGDLSKVKVFNDILHIDGKTEFFTLFKDNHFKAFERAVDGLPDLGFVCFDSIDSYLGFSLDGSKSNQVRAILHPLIKLAERRGITILGICHLNKDSSKKPIYRLLNSIAFQAAPRSVWGVSQDEDDPAGSKRFFSPIKTNLSKNPTTLAFSIDGPLGRPVITFEPDPVDKTSSELLSDEESKNQVSALREARLWLQQILADGPITASEIYKAADENRISTATLKRAKSGLNVKSHQQDRKWIWEL